MPNHLCTITDAEALAFVDPSTTPDFLNADYVEDTNLVQPWMQINIYVGDTAYNFARQYESTTMEIEKVFGARGFCSFVMHDIDSTAFNWPFMPVRHQQVWIKDFDGNKTLFRGYIKQIIHETILGYRTNGTAKKHIRFECEDLFYLLEQDTYSEVYENKTGGFILKDAFNRAGLDTSDLDTAIGPTFELLPVNDEYPIDTIEKVIAYMDYTYWIDPVTLKPILSAKDATTARAATVTDETNWTDLYSKIELSENTDGEANKIIMVFRSKYNTGTANFQNGSNIVLGFSGNEDWYTLEGELSIENVNTGEIKRIKQNNSTSGGTNELELESNWDDTTQTNVPYIIRGHIDKIERRDSTHQNWLAAIRGGNGVLTKKITMYQDVAFFRSEARKIADIELSIGTRQLCTGFGDTDNYKFQEWVEPGQTFEFDLLQTQGIKCVTRLEAIRMTDTGARLTQSDGTRINKFTLTHDFTPSVFSSREQIREITKSLTKVGAQDSDTYILDIEFIESEFVFKDCVNVIEPITELAADASIAEFEDSLNPREYTVQDYYWTPTANPEFAWLGFNKIAIWR